MIITVFLFIYQSDIQQLVSDMKQWLPLLFPQSFKDTLSCSIEDVTNVFSILADITQDPNMYVSASTYGTIII